MFFISVIILVTIYSISRILLDLHQIAYIESTPISDNELNLIKLNQEYVEKSKLYNIEKDYNSKKYYNKLNDINNFRLYVWFFFKKYFFKK